MMEERYHTTTQNRFYPDMSNVNQNITVEAKLISQPTYIIAHSNTVVIDCAIMYILLTIKHNGDVPPENYKRDL